MKFISKIKNNFRIYLSVVFLSLFLTLSPIQAKPTYAWLDMVDEFLDIGLEEMADMLKGIILGSMKTSAAQSIMSQASSIVGGSNPMFVTNYKDFLVDEPTNSAKKYANDLISQSTSGRGLSSYEGFGNNAGGGNHVRQLAQVGQQVISENKPSVTYFEDSNKMFDNGNFKSMESYLSGINNPWSYKNYITGEYAQKLEEEKEVSKTTVISGQGFLGKMQNGNVQTPGSLTKEIMANAQDLGNKITAGATRFPEVITSVISSSLSQALKSGLSKVKSKINKKTNSTGSATINADTIQQATEAYMLYQSGGE